MAATSGTMVLFTPKESHTNVPKPNIIVIPLKSEILYTTIDDYPEFETKRPMKKMQLVESECEIFDSIASRVIHIVIDPLDCNMGVLELVKKKCVNIKRLTIDANLKDNSDDTYTKRILLTKKNVKELCQKALAFISSFDQVEEFYLGPKVNLISDIYITEKWAFSRRLHVNAKGYYQPTFSTEFLKNLNPNLKVMYLGDVFEDSFDLRDAGSTCSKIIAPLPSSKSALLAQAEGGPTHICLNRATDLRVLSIQYFESGYHSDTVVELILYTLSGDNKVHEMFPNLKKLTVNMFCPFVMDMSGTGNAGLYDGVVIDELEVELQLPCFCRCPVIFHSEDAMVTLQTMLFLSFRELRDRMPNSTESDCICTDVASIELFKTLKIVKLRCFDDTVVRFILKLHQLNGNAKIILYEKSRFEGHPDHRSFRQNLSKLAKVTDAVPHDKIEIVMKKTTGNELKKMKFRLARFVPENVRISFTD